MELARNESCASRSSEGSERRASPSDTPPMQTLREAVWSKVAGTLLKQVTIFGQYIFEGMGENYGGEEKG